MAPPASAKLLPPRLDGAVHRRRLLARLDALAAGAGAAWLEGPAGTGKTTLAADWWQRAAASRLWYRVDPGDADPVAFFADLADAVRRASPRSRRPLPGPRPAAADPVGHARRLFRAAWARLGGGAVMVLDDLHALPMGSYLEDVLPEALAERPPGCALVLVSRRPPPSALARAEAHGGLGRIGPEALAFTSGETARLVRAVAGRRPDAARVEAIQRRSGGWAVAVRVLCRDERSHPDAAGTPREDLDRYLETEVLAGLGDAERRALVAAALLPDVTGPALVALCEDPRAEAALAALEARGALVRRHGARAAGAVYVLHDLLRELLLERGAAELGAVRFAELARRAAASCEAAGRPERAAEALMKAGDADALAGLVERQAGPLAAFGRRRTVERWLAALPAATLAKRPALRLWQGVCRLADDPPGARAILEQAFDDLCREGDADAAWLAWAATADSFFVGRGDAARMAAWLAGYEAVQAGLGPPRPGGVELAVLTARLVTGVGGDPADPALEACAERALAWIEQPLPPQARVGLGIGLVHRLAWSGDLARLDAVLDLVRPLVDRDEVDPWARFHWHGAEATAARCRGDREGCLEHVARAEALAREAEGRAAHAGPGLAHVRAQAVWTLLQAGDAAEAGARLAVFARALDGAGEFERAEYDTLRGLAALAAREPARAEGHLDRALAAPAATLGPALLPGIARTLRARARLEQGDEDGAAHDLAAAERHASGNPLVLLAAALVRAERPGESRAPLADALVRAAHAGLGVVPGCLPDRLASLCARALREGVAPEAVRLLVRRLGLPAPGDPRLAWPARVEIRTLGGLALAVDGRPLEPARVRPRARHLLEALVAAGGRDVAVLDLLEALCPDAAHGPAGQRSFDTTLHRLRRALGVEHALVSAAGRLGLDPRHVALDAWRLEALAAEPGEDARRDLDAALAAYRGPFLGDVEGPFVERAREALREALARVVSGFARARPEEGAAAFERALARDPAAEPLHRAHLRWLRDAGREADRAAAWARCRRELGGEPGPETRALAPDRPPAGQGRSGR